MKSKRPWKKRARITQITLNSGDVKFRTELHPHVVGNDVTWVERGVFESLLEAEMDLDHWYADWWPKQTKSVKRA